jgi:hypothetical protein
MSDKRLHWVELHGLTLGIGHNQDVLRLIEQLYNMQGILGGVGVVGGAISRLCDSGWHNLELYKHFTITAPLKQFIKSKYSKLSFLNRKICYSSVICICSANILVLTCHNN